MPGASSDTPSVQTTDPRRILLIRPSALGDVCRSVPVLVSLKRRWPGAEIDWMVQEEFAPAVAAHPDLSSVVPFPRKRFEGWWKSPATAAALRAWLRDLRARRYDLAIDCQGLARSGLFTWATRAPRRVGYRNAQEFGWLGYTSRHTVRRDMHAVDRMLELIRLEGVEPVRDMRLFPSPSDIDWAARRLPMERLVVLAPTSRWPGKQWPADRFASLAERLLQDEPGLRVALVGAASERSQVGDLLALAARDPRVIDLLGQTTVGQLLAVVARASLVVANDSAALHMAVGAQRPIVAMFGPTRVALVGPYARSSDVLQHVRPGDTMDHKDAASGRLLMERISVEEAHEACAQRLTHPGTLRTHSSQNPA